MTEHNQALSLSVKYVHISNKKVVADTKSFF